MIGFEEIVARMKCSEIRENPEFRPIDLHPGYKSFYTASKSAALPDPSRSQPQPPPRYAAPLLSTLLLLAFGKAEASWIIGAACALIVGGALLASREL